MDDASVLKQELIAVQKAMDEALNEKESAFNTLFYEKQKLVDELEAFRKCSSEESSDGMVANLTMEKSILEQQILNLTKDLADKQKTLADLEENLADKEAKLVEFMSHCDNLKVEKVSLEAALRGKCEELDVIAADWQAQLEQHALEERLADLKLNYEAAEKRGSELTAEKGRLEARLTETGESRERLKVETNELRMKIAELESEASRWEFKKGCRH